MSKHVLVVQSNGLPGREDDYNKWYSETHLDDVLKVPGMLSAQRFKLAQDDPNAKQKYLAIYEFETDDVTKTFAELNARAGTPDMMISDAFDAASAAVVPWVAITDKKAN
jgi:hypothetical protein